jgi:hypothetical protein
MKKGGRVRTVVPKPGTYLKVCYPKGSSKGKGKAHPVSGELHHTKS